jgi:hypothetical protein
VRSTKGGDLRFTTRFAIHRLQRWFDALRFLVSPRFDESLEYYLSRMPLVEVNGCKVGYCRCYVMPNFVGFQPLADLATDLQQRPSGVIAMTTREVQVYWSTRFGLGMIDDTLDIGTLGDTGAIEQRVVEHPGQDRLMNHLQSANSLMETLTTAFFATFVSTGGKSSAKESSEGQLQCSTHRCHACTICLSDFEGEDSVVFAGCAGAHCFHMECLRDWIVTSTSQYSRSSSCPTCRHRICSTDCYSS